MRAVGPYRLIEQLGRGGMGEVWLADDPTGAAGGAPRRVALKLLDAGVAANPAVRTRFAREVAALRRIASPYVAPLLDADVDAPVPWLASAYVAGPTLADHVSRHGPLGEAPLRALAVALAEALAAIHAAGVVHRDLTPRNVVLGPDGPRVVDFGIAWFPDAVPVTREGSSVGTPAWMAPERTTSGEATTAGDVWSWGMVLAYAARGGAPAAAPAARPGAEVPGLPPWLASWVGRALSTDPAARPSAADLRSALATAPTGPVGDATVADPARTVPDPIANAPDVTRPVEPTLVAPTREAEPARTGRGRGRDAAWWASAVAVLAAAAAIGAVTGLLASILVAAVVFVLSLALQFRRGDQADGARHIPPTWALALAGPVVLGVALVQEFGVAVGVVVLVVLVLLFAVVAGDMLM
jgi:serine/threonine protein kinase